MNKTIKKSEGLRGVFAVPGDKSISHRALILGSLCNGKVAIHNLSSGEDCTSTCKCLQKLGVEIIEKDDKTIIRGEAEFKFAKPGDILDAGNSGTTMRLLSGLLSAQKFDSCIDGDNSLRRRPMKRIIEPLSRMGASISAKDNNNFPPLQITGRDLHAIRYRMPVASAQVKSAILLAGLQCNDVTTVTEKIKTRDHSERMLEFLGGNLKYGNGDISIAKGRLEAHDLFIPGDISSAIFIIIAGLLIPGSEILIKNVGLNPTRTGCLEVLKSMGANITILSRQIRSNEPYGDIRVQSSKLQAVDITRQMIPSLVDEVPILSLAASQANGTTVISGAGELRLKESDRLHGCASQLNAMGADIVETEDGLIIHGGKKFGGNVVESFNDHRLAMMLSIAGMIAEGETVVRDAESASISFPEFYEYMGI